MLIDKKYQKIYPTEKYISDDVILINAWKKAQQYIRSTSWYVDYLDLDKSAVELDNRINKLKESLLNKEYTPDLLELIPAPKSQKWGFIAENKDGSGNLIRKWRPLNPEKPSNMLEELHSLRPLAHVSINDQMLFTALMMLIADKVESLQGDPSLKYEEVHNYKVINYGNRLHCSYNDSLARFSWGNSNVYSKFYKDYQRFLNRPKYFGRQAIELKKDNEEIFEVQLDFSKFYDCVDRQLLVNKISSIIKEINNTNKIEPSIAHILKKFKEWKWTADSKKLYKKTCSNNVVPNLKTGKGIPQGLVVGGFFSNIYMLDIDEHISSLIGNYLDEDNGIYLVDACRYVDDLRLIVKCKKNTNSKSKIILSIKENIGEILTKHALEFQEKKTKVKIFNHKSDTISTKLEDIQDKISGPMTMGELDEQLGHLEGLIELSDNLTFDDESLKKQQNALEYIDTTFVDLRKDTLLRFSANKIHLLLSQKRHLVSQNTDKNGNVLPGSWDFLQERMARKLLAKWTSDPSLVPLLKKSIEMFPHVKLLKPVLENLDDIISITDREDLISLAEYCLSEIFRHSAIQIYNKNKWSFPAHSDTSGYFAFLSNYAIEKLRRNEKISKILLEQMLMYCLVVNESSLKIETENKTFNVMTQLINGYRNIDDDMTGYDCVSTIILSYQFAHEKSKVIKSVNTFFEYLYNKEKNKSASQRNRSLEFSVQANSIRNICNSVLIEDYDLFESIYTYAKKLKLKWVSKIKETINYLAIDKNFGIRDDLQRFNNKQISLLSILRSDGNPFIHENAILKLTESILNSSEQISFNKPIDIANCLVTCSDWGGILKLDSHCDLKIDVKNYEQTDNYLHKAPTWVTKEHKPLYFLGMFIRSCLLGRVDWSYTPKICQDNYKGLRTNILKKQMGMMHSPEIFGRASSCITQWLSSLIFNLLQWPGVEVYQDNKNFKDIFILANLKTVINDRIKYQREIYCRLSDIPSYVEKVNLRWPDEKKDMSVIMVQSLLPVVDDFKKHGLKLDDINYRSKHRRHLSAVAELILHNIVAMDSKHDKPKLKGKVDLIVWPELSVSKDDIDILQRLCDKTGAIIFAGMIFDHVDNELELNNSALWLIPDKSNSGRRFIKRLQGKWNMTTDEKSVISPWRPYQLFIEIEHPAFPNKNGFRLTGSICYDATDIKLNADLKGKSHAYVITAMNKDVSTFDNMVNALFYHMYQYVILVNSGEFGGSVAKAPYKESYDRLITHVHGTNQVSLSFFEINLFDFINGFGPLKSTKEPKTKPAGEF